MLTQEQIAAAHKANLETFFGLTNKAFEGVEKLVELNLQVVKATLAENVEHAKKALTAKDAQELLSVQTAAVQPLAEKVLAYSRHLYEIASDTQTEFSKAAEVQIAENSRKLQALVDNVSKNAPAGSESAVALVKSALSAANKPWNWLKATSTLPPTLPARQPPKLRLRRALLRARRRRPLPNRPLVSAAQAGLLREARFVLPLEARLQTLRLRIFARNRNARPAVHPTVFVRLSPRYRQENLSSVVISGYL